MNSLLARLPIVLLLVGAIALTACDDDDNPWCLFCGNPEVEFTADEPDPGPHSVTLQPGGILGTVLVTVIDIPDIESIAFTLSWSPEVVDLQDALPLDYFGEPQVSVENLSPGRVRVRVSGRPGVGASQGSGYLISTLFSKVATGETGLFIEELELFDRSGEMILGVDRAGGVLRTQ